MTQRFENASLVLGPVDRRSAALCRFAGRPGAEQNTAALAVIDAALDFTERLEGVDDVRELLGLWKVAHVWGHPTSDMLELPRLSAVNAAVAGGLQDLLGQLAPEQLRELGIALSVDHDMVALALELVEEAAAGSRDFSARSMAELEVEDRLHEDRIGHAVDVLLLDAPGDWPPLQRAALTLALVWDVADLIVFAAQLSAVDALPAALLWQVPGVDHACASARVPVPGTDLLVWAKIDPIPFDGRPLWSQAPTIALWRWSISWQHADGSNVHYKGGRAPSTAAARWQAQWAMQKLLTDPHRAKSPATGDPLIVPR
ncbi:hypothetical protein [Streptomyces botrytidirepellens]|uniref:Uncharacterized protein n=1 Tax=Streptomyces botrytidirepellens TaxID=2486417 RepID=A0A3M8WWU6_9ACTN|nr:hypothetical protein [Streptomyces botrytidirepellens]RNG33520.1 hypothetical protein EEJ42_07390 [Streptomyces botrytidirepellens]